MGNAMLGGRRFRLNPTSVSWEFKTKVADLPTVGGKVVQVYGTSISDMVLTGTFGAGGWREQLKFLRDMKDLASQQVAQSAQVRASNKLTRFIYPDRNWDFMVYLKAYSNPAGGRSVVLDNNIVAPQWTLTLFIVEDNSGLKKVAQDAYLARLSKGLGWRQTAYNGPMDGKQVTEYLDGKTVGEYLTEEFGLGTVTTGNTEGGTSPTNTRPDGTSASGGGSSDGSVAGNKALGKQMAAGYGWTGREWDALLELWTGESGWNHQADNPGSSAYGIPQALVDYPGRTIPAGYYGTRTGGTGASANFKGGDPAVQIRWGLNYIKGAYGSPSKALAAWKSRNPHWY